MKHFLALCSLLILPILCCFAQEAETDTSSESNEWTFSAAANWYVIGEDSYVNPVFKADKDHLHLEARYNYEDLKTGSVFAGYNLSFGNEVEFAVTPMVGAVFGNSDGIAPGLIWEVNWKKLNFYTESEYLFEFSDKEANFYYAWAELTFSPAEWVWFGIAAQRTKLYQTDLEVQRGITLGFTKNIFSLTGSLFNPGDDQYGVISLEVEF